MNFNVQHIIFFYFFLAINTFLMFFLVFDFYNMYLLFLKTSGHAGNR